MRKALLFAFAMALTVATLPTKPVQAAPLTCGCWCGRPAYRNYKCVLPNGGTMTCSVYFKNYC